MGDEPILDDDSILEENPEDKTDVEEPEEEPKKNDKKDRRSEVAQKIKWREKAKANGSEVQALKAALSKLKDLVKKPTDDQEAKAQEYIRAQARAVFEELQRAKDSEERQRTSAFESQVQEALDDNPDVSEEELLDLIEELDVSPAIALKILKRGGAKKEKEKPKLPKSGRSSPETPKEKPDDKGKSLYDIAREEISKIRGN
mgnify:CR=1 FL=1